MRTLTIRLDAKEGARCYALETYEPAGSTGKRYRLSISPDEGLTMNASELRNLIKELSNALPRTGTETYRVHA